MDELTSFGAWLKQRRKALDLTQDDLAQRVGVAIGTVRKWEADERRPAKDIAARLAEALEVLPAEQAAVRKAARAEMTPDRLPPATVRRVATPLPPQRAPRADRPNNLPVQRDPLIGRQQEVADVVALLQRDDIGLVTLTGPGGTGKTRLALQVAADLVGDFADGVWFVDLAPIDDSFHVATTLAARLGVTETSGEQLVETLKRFLRQQTVLLVLDNFEHVVDAARFLAELLSAARGLKLLVTSRELLHLSDEQEYPVPPLALPELPPAVRSLPSADRVRQSPAVELFIRRARRARPDMQITDETTFAVAEICTRLDGLPLPIELAAARTRLFSPSGLLQRLDQPLNLLTGGARDVHARQQTLRNTIAWSYDLLDAGEQRLFRRLAVFVGGCTIEAVEAVCNVEGDLPGNVLDGLESLGDKSLLRQMEHDGSEPRFRMLETIREYAQEHLQASGEAETLQRSHAAYYLRLAEAAQPNLHGTSRLTTLARLRRELDNLRAALRWSQTNDGGAEISLRLSAALWYFWLEMSQHEGEHWLDSSLQRRAEAPAAAQAHALAAAADLAWRRGDLARAEQLADESRQLCRALGDKAGTAFAAQTLGHVLRDRDDPDRALVLYQEGLALRREVGDTVWIAWSLADLGSMAFSRARYAQARAWLTESLALFRQVDDTGGLTYTLRELGDMACDEGDQDAAAVYYEESLHLSTARGDAWNIAASSGRLGALAQRQGSDAQSMTLLVDGLNLIRSLGNILAITSILLQLAELAVTCGQAERATRLLGAVDGLLGTTHELVAQPSRDMYDRVLSAVSTQVNATRFATVWATGQVMTLEQAIAYALEVGLCQSPIQGSQIASFVMPTRREETF